MNISFHFNSTKVKGNREYFAEHAKLKTELLVFFGFGKWSKIPKCTPVSLTCLKRSSSMYVTFSLRLVPSNRPSSKGIAINRSVNYLPINQKRCKFTYLKM